MNKIIISVAVLVLVAIAGFILTGGDPVESQDEQSLYFRDQVVELALERVGQPIEGFNAFLLQQAFPGLTDADFEGAETIEGHYEIVGGKLSFVRDQSQPTTSAEEMISAEGYQTLLSRLESRLEIDAADQDAVNRIILSISKSSSEQYIETKIDQGASAQGVKVVPLEVLEDSRCPVDAACVQAGTVRVRALIQSGLGDSEMVFVLDGEPITTEAEAVTLVGVSPEASAGVAVESQEYVFRFFVEKRQANE